jgi:hypothetical protein
VIVSGGYEVVLADEPIGFYERPFCRSDWPNQLLEDILVAFTRRKGLMSVRAFASATSGYAKLLQAVRWKDAQVHDAWLFLPEKCAGARRKSPRAQGEALVALLGANLTADWRSSDDLRLNSVPLA